jgi:hypothetical protein
MGSGCRIFPSLTTPCYLYNLYWHEGSGTIRFAGKTWIQWQATGHDLHSLVADPLFRDPARGNFNLPPRSPARQIGFTPFNLDKAGPR